MLKTMIILAVAYGLLVVMRISRGAMFSPRRRLGANFLLYGFATFGIMAGAGLVWLIIYVSQVSSSPSSAGANPDPALILPVSQKMDHSQEVNIAGLRATQNFKARTQPAYVLLHPGGPDLARPAESEWGTLRLRSPGRK
ncbi:MAG: hypothetical protein PHW74_01860 [Desulfobacca sp.]|nr:hypothetical protein [Desulfobacca sp.]